MKKIFLLTIALCLVIITQAQTTVTTTAGNLKTDLQMVVGSTKLNTVTNLKVIGTLNASDMTLFGAYTRGGLQKLVTLDLSEVTAIENKTIPDKTFYQLENLTTVKLPTGDVLSIIGSEAFASTTNLTSINIPNSVTTIKDYAFSSTALTDVVLPNSVTTLGDGVFMATQSLKDITLSENLTEIPRSAFQGATGLTSITIPDKVKTINSQAFWNATGLTTINFSANSQLEWLGGFNTFNGAPITALNLPSSTQVIDGLLNGTFQGSKLTSFTIPSNVTAITDWAFQGNQFTNIVIPEGVTTIGNGVFQNVPLKEVAFPNSVTSIGAYLFSYSEENTSITSIKFGTGLTSLGEGALTLLTNVAALELPSALTNISESAFSGMSGLKKLIVNNPQPVIFSTETGVFNGVKKGNDDGAVTLYVPESSLTLYKESDLWKDFTPNIKAIGSNAVANEIGNFNDLIIEKGSVSTITLAATAKGDRSVAYTIEDGKTGVATLSNDVVTIVGEGTATITAKVKGDNDYQEATKTITLTVVDYSWLQEVSIAIQGKTAKVVGPSESVAKFTKFYIDNASVTATDGKIDLSDKTGDITIKATTDDGSGIIRLKANVGGTQKSAMKISDAAPLPYLLRK